MTPEKNLERRFSRRLSSSITHSLSNAKQTTPIKNWSPIIDRPTALQKLAMSKLDLATIKQFLGKPDDNKEYDITD